jgi:hypothetical protein
MCPVMEQAQSSHRQNSSPPLEEMAQAADCQPSKVEWVCVGPMCLFMTGIRLKRFPKLPVLASTCCLSFVSKTSLQRP